MENVVFVAKHFTFYTKDSLHIIIMYSLIVVVVLTNDILAQLQVKEMACKGLDQTIQIFHIVFHQEEHSECFRAITPSFRSILDQFMIHFKKDVLPICNNSKSKR